MQPLLPVPGALFRRIFSADVLRVTAGTLHSVVQSSKQQKSKCSAASEGTNSVRGTLGPCTEQKAMLPDKTCIERLI